MDHLQHFLSYFGALISSCITYFNILPRRHYRMKITKNSGVSRFIAETPEEIQLASSSKIIPLQELEVCVRMARVLPEIDGSFVANPSENNFIANELKKNREQFDVFLESTNENMPFKKVKACFLTAINFETDTLYCKFHCITIKFL